MHRQRDVRGQSSRACVADRNAGGGGRPGARTQVQFFLVDRDMTGAGRRSCGRRRRPGRGSGWSCGGGRSNGGGGRLGGACRRRRRSGCCPGRRCCDSSGGGGRLGGSRSGRGGWRCARGRSRSFGGSCSFGGGRGSGGSRRRGPCRGRRSGRGGGSGARRRRRFGRGCSSGGSRRLRRYCVIKDQSPIVPAVGEIQRLARIERESVAERHRQYRSRGKARSEDQ